MTRATIVRYKTRPDAAEENERLIRAVFEELARDPQDGLRYAAFRLEDGVSFVHVAITEGDRNPLQELSAFREFASTAGQRCVEGPVPASGAIVGSYRMDEHRMGEHQPAPAGDGG